MKKRMVLIMLVVAVLIAGGVIMPRMVQSSIPAAYYITPTLKSYENVINCTGTIQSAEVRQIILQTPVIAEQVLCSVGDTVNQGEVLVKIDSDKTNSIGTPISFIRDISGDMAVSQYSGIDWTALASSYGMSAAVNGGLQGLDSGTISDIIGSAGAVTKVDVGTMFSDIQSGEIVAPISGVIVSVDIQPDIPASSGKGIVTIADNKSYNVMTAIREEDIGRVQVGDAVKVYGVGFQGSVYDGEISKIYPTARKNFSGTTAETVVDAEIILSNVDSNLRSGFSAKVEILGGNDFNLITVPYEAIKQDENNREYVYLYENGKLIKQVVTTGQELASEVEILSGVSADSIVVYNPTDQIKEGAMINIKGRANID